MVMISEVMDPHGVNDSEPSTAAEQAPPVFPQSNPLCREMNLPELAAQCLQEIEQYRRGEPSQESSSVELLRRATVADDQEAWVLVQHCFGGLVRGWLRRHPLREQASRFESDENYVAQAFARFWLAQAHHERLEFRSLAAALSYLRACLNGVILDTLRCYQRFRELPLPEPGWVGEPLVADEESSELWESIQHLLPTVRERRVAYLLFHCGLKPREMVQYCPQEFGQVSEIYRLRRNILLRLQRHADQIRWRLQRVSGC